MIKIDADAKFLITGGTGLVGRALEKELASLGFKNVEAVGSKDCDLRDGNAVLKMMGKIKPDFVFHLAARVHGLGGNAKYKSDVLVENTLINTHVIEHSRRQGVKKIVAMGSGCVYPDMEGQEEYFENQIWLGAPHPSEDSYAHTKRLMLAHLDATKKQYGLSSAFVISGNLYGPHDNFNTEDGHVIPSLVAKFHKAKSQKKPVKVWGSGVAIRDFTYCSDMAKALISILYNIEGAVNAGSGQRHAIKEIVDILQEITGVEVEWETDKPDGQLERYYNLEILMSTGYRANVALSDGIKETYNWFSENLDCIRT